MIPKFSLKEKIIFGVVSIAVGILIVAMLPSGSHFVSNMQLFLVPTAIGAGAYVAYQNLLLAKKKRSDDLYDRRFAVIESIVGFRRDVSNECLEYAIPILRNSGFNVIALDLDRSKLKEGWGVVLQWEGVKDQLSKYMENFSEIDMRDKGIIIDTILKHEIFIVHSKLNSIFLRVALLYGSSEAAHIGEFLGKSVDEVYKATDDGNLISRLIDKSAIYE